VVTTSNYRISVFLTGSRCNHEGMTAATSVVKLRVVLGTAGALIGLVAVTVTFEAGEPFVWMTDLAAGLAFVALAAYAVPIAPSVTQLASWMVLAWFAGSVLPFAVFWHRGVLIHVLLAYPTLLPRSRSSRVGVLMGYAASATPFIWRDEALSAALAVTVLAMVAGQKTGSRGRHSRILVLGAAAAFAIVVTGGSVARSFAAHNAAVVPALIAYSLVIAGIAVVLGIGLRRADRVQLTDLVVELGEYPSGTLRDLLARAVGDPSLAVGYWNWAKGAYLDSAGIPLDPPRAGDMRALTPIDRDGNPFVLIVHDESVLDDPLLVSAAATAAHLAAANAQLHSELRLRVDEVAASRRRILSSADEERRRLQGELQGTVSAPLEELARHLAAVTPPSEGASESVVGTARTLLDRAIGELSEIGSGLHPRELHRGLRAAVGALADRCPVPVSVSVVGLRFSPEIEAAAYYTCAEALANSARYSGASSISIDVTVRAGDLLIVVADDGRGGADPAQGTGLRGLADRLDAVGGRFAVYSPPGGGTRLSATIPVA
jgi:signal transduction histidine kinase